METKNIELNKQLSPIELRAIYDLFNRKFTVIPKSISEYAINYPFFTEIDFSQMSVPIPEIKSLNTLKQLNDEIKRNLFIKIIRATQDLLWSDEQKFLLYLQYFKLIGAREIMMFNCSYILRELLPHINCERKFTNGDFFYYEMRLEEQYEYDNFNAYIYISTDSKATGNYLHIFIDDDTINYIFRKAGFFTIEGGLNYISKKLDENLFMEYGNYKLSYTKQEPFRDAIRKGFWFPFNDIKIQ